MATDEITSAIVREFGSYLKVACPSIVDIYDNFPSPTQKLKYPSGTMSMGNPKFIPWTPYVIYKSNVIVGGPNDGKVFIRRCVGCWEFNLKFEIWTDNKFKRHALFAEFFKGFNQDPTVPGLNLQLATYFNQWAHYSIDSINFIDDEASSQRNEWRISVSIIADVKAVIESVGYLIETIENNLDVTDQTIPSDDSVDEVLL